jgi:enterochelin esterase-like enzyme
MREMSRPMSGVLAVLLVVGVILSLLCTVACGEQLMSPKIHDLQARLEKAKPEDRDGIVSGFIQANKGLFPLVEDSLATFVYSGKVVIRACVPSDINRWDIKGDRMARLGDTDLYYVTLDLPLDARIDYKFHIDGLWMLDPLNDRTVKGGFGDNSELRMPRYLPPSEIVYVDSINHGDVDVHQFESKIIPSSRKIQVYHPYGYDDRKAYPVVFVQDGGEYVMLAQMVNVLDNLISEGKIPPCVAVFIDPVDRNYEYWLNADYQTMVLDEIVPLIRDQYAITSDPRETAIMGASLGGAIAMMIALDHSAVFGKCGCQSGAFDAKDGGLFTMVGGGPKVPVDFYLDCGRFGDLLDENHRMRDLLEEKGYGLKYQEFNEGHSWGNWRAHIDDMLIFFWGKGESNEKPEIH